MNTLILEDAASTRITHKRAKSSAALASVVATLLQKITRPGRTVLLAAVCLIAAAAQGQPTVPTTFVLPSSAADTSKPGFVWRIHEVSTGQPNSNARTETELAGLLGDNIADPNAQGTAIGPATPANPSTPPITFELPGVITMTVG